MWQAMLMSAGLPNSQHIIIDGFITSGGQKMSKSLGNVVSPFDVIETYRQLSPFPEDVLRFVLLHDIPSFEDGDLTMESIASSYAANLQNGIGNLTNRLMKMSSTHGVQVERGMFVRAPSTPGVHEAFDIFDLQKALAAVVERMRSLDRLIQEKEPFKKIKIAEQEAKEDLKEMLVELYAIGRDISHFLPRTGAAVMQYVQDSKMPEVPLFNRPQ
jgi:methionyl-tRNA synthetase